MLFPLQPQQKSQTKVALSPPRDYRLQIEWSEEGLKQRRLGDVCPFLDRTLREKLVGTRFRFDENGEIDGWAETPSENERLAFLAALQSNDPGAIAHLDAWLAEVERLSPVAGYRNRLFPRVWRADRGFTRLHLAEQGIKGKVDFWGWNNWNALNFWSLPDPEEVDPDYSPGDSPALERIVAFSRNRAVLFQNFDGATDLYGTPTGSFALEFWINPRWKGTKPGVVLHTTGSTFGINFAILPEVNRPVALEVEGEPDKFHLAVVSESALTPGANAVGTFLAAETLAKPNWADWTDWAGDGWFGTAPLIERGAWSHCVVSWDAVTNTFGVVVNGRVAFSRTLASAPANLPWWSENAPQAPSFLCFGARPEISSITELEEEFDFNDPTPALSVSNTFGDPLNAELTGIRVWSRPLSRAQFSERRGGLLSSDPLRRFLLFELDLAFRGDAPARPHATLGTDWTVRTDDAPINSEIAWGRGDVVLNLDGYLRENVRNNWGLGVGSFSERKALPDLINKESSDVYLTVYGLRNGAIVPNDNGAHRPSATKVEEIWSGLPLRMRTDYPSVLLDASSFGTLPSSSSVLNALRDGRTRSSMFLEVSSLFYGSEIVELLWKQNLALAWALTVLQTEIDFDGDVEFDGSSAPWMFGDHERIKVFFEAIASNPQYQRSLFEVVSKGDLLFRGNSFPIGALIAEHGLACVHPPCLWRVGELETTIQMRGNRMLFVNEWLLPIESGELTRQGLEPIYPEEALLPHNDPAPLVGNDRAVGITEAVLFDRRLNPIARAKMAQPIYRVPADRLAVKIKLDF